MENINEENKKGNENAVTGQPEKNEKGHIIMTRDEFERAKLAQNLPIGVVAAIVAAILSAILWAVISYATGYQIGYMAIAVGAVVGFALRKVGKGVTQPFGIAGAVIALLGCLLGNILTVVGAASLETGSTFGEAFAFVSSDLVAVMVNTFHPMDLVFYILAIGAGYRFAFKNIEVR